MAQSDVDSPNQGAELSGLQLISCEGRPGRKFTRVLEFFFETYQSCPLILVGTRCLFLCPTRTMDARWRYLAKMISLT